MNRKRQLKCGVVSWHDAMYSDRTRLPAIPKRIHISFGFVDGANKKFIRVGMNCFFDEKTGIKVVDGICIPRKAVKKIYYFHEFKF